ncbi:pyrrolidone-carboxylate peptidase [Deinococcus sp.]|uniref:pyroglutamyl-peptidase I family protein n=1 Tax=Deinococcus sp. TaxID=47478 RepID=UPI00345D59BD
MADGYSKNSQPAYWLLIKCYAVSDFAVALGIEAALLPVEPHGAAKALLSALEHHQPDAVLLTGLAAGRAQVALERVAVNVMDFDIPDNAGQVYRDAPVHPHAQAPAAYLSTLPLRRILSAWHAAQLPGYVSNSAGLYVCNAVMYQALHHLHTTGRSHVPCGFVHLPASAEVALAVPQDRPPVPYLPQPEITRAVWLAAESIAQSLA